MARKKKRSNGEDANVDMTPMIDVVFQLIIFFVVTITMADAKDNSIRLELAPDGEEVESASENPDAATSITIDVNRKGRMSMSNVTMNEKQLRDIMARRFKKFGNNFEVWIRGDALATHNQIRRAMDICTDCGIGKVSFLAVKDTRTPEQRDFFAGSNTKDAPHATQYRTMKRRITK
ncbi:MAG: biopolymer transporter ExbD [Kiritimatiellae bacterium]|jgi:biopolymer transport protein ExbD|nr:biopolymer transporter ExbD [Kiritimatiellia bacterium]